MSVWPQTLWPQTIWPQTVWPLAACAVLVLAGSAVQVAVGAGLSVVCGAFLLVWLGPAGVPVLLCLNLLVSVVAALAGGWRLRWGDVALAAAATLAGCLAAAAGPALPVGLLKLVTAAVLAVVALPRPRVSDGPARAALPVVGLAGLLTGALTVWTATPGPIMPVALARAGRSGDAIRRAMQPISVVGYGAALARAGVPPLRGLGGAGFGTLLAAALAGTGIGLLLRRRIAPGRVVAAIRVIAGLAAALLVLSVALRLR